MLHPAINNFTEFYINKFNGQYGNKCGRQLTWKLDFGSADVIANFSKRYEMKVSTFQMCILVTIFNERAGPFRYEEIRDKTQIQPH